MKQKPYQFIGSLFLASRKNAILADEMGLGKTNQAVCAVDMLSLSQPIEKLLVICPAVVRPQWESQLAQWLLFHNQHPVQQVESKDATITGNTVLISYSLINVSAILNQLTAQNWDVAIYDEFQYMKNVDAHRTTNVLGKDGIIPSCDRNWFLSGTPVTSKPSDLFPILVTIARRRLHPHTTWKKYILHFCDAYKDEYGYWKHHGSSNLEELSEILAGIMLRRLVEDVEPDLSKPLWHEVSLELTQEAQESYEREIDEIESIYESTQQRTILANLKGGVIYEHLRLIMHSEKKLVVFYHHKSLGRYLQARIEQREVFKIDGGVPVKRRHSIVAEFNKAKYAVLLAQSDAAGTGLDGLQHGAKTCYFAEMPWNPDVRDQNIYRLLRLGQRHKVKAILPVLRNTVDEMIFNGLYRKEKIVNTILKKGQ